MAMYLGSQRICPIVKSGITPSGTYTITANGTYDVTNYASADVSISSGGGGTNTLYCWKIYSTYGFTNSQQPLTGDKILMMNGRNVNSGTINSDSDGLEVSVSSANFNGTLSRESASDFSF